MLQALHSTLSVEVNRVEWSLDGATTYNPATPARPAAPPTPADWSSWSADTSIPVASIPTTHTVTVRCFDNANNTAVSSITLNVAPISLTYLGDLLYFAARRVKVNAQDHLSRGALKAAFHQPF